MAALWRSGEELRTKHAIPGLRDELYHRELVWQSPFSNSSDRISPHVPRGRWVEWVDVKYDCEYGVCCKVENRRFSLPFLADRYIKRYFESV